MGEGIRLLGDLSLLLTRGLRTHVLRRGSGGFEVSKPDFPNSRKKGTPVFSGILKLPASPLPKSSP